MAHHGAGQGEEFLLLEEEQEEELEEQSHTQRRTHPDTGSGQANCRHGHTHRSCDIDHGYRADQLTQEEVEEQGRACQEEHCTPGRRVEAG